MHVPSTVASRDRPNNVDIGIAGKGRQPVKLDVDVGVRVLLVEINAKCEGSFACIDAKDDVREAIYEPQSQRVDRVLLEGLDRQRSQAPDLPRFGEVAPCQDRHHNSFA